MSKSGAAGSVGCRDSSQHRKSRFNARGCWNCVTVGGHQLGHFVELLGTHMLVSAVDKTLGPTSETASRFSDSTIGSLRMIISATWDERWNAGEREVDEHVRKGEIIVSETVEDFMTHLTAISKE
jgi:hypothetical protein